MKRWSSGLTRGGAECRSGNCTHGCAAGPPIEGPTDHHKVQPGAARSAPQAAARVESEMRPVRVPAYEAVYEERTDDSAFEIDGRGSTGYGDVGWQPSCDRPPADRAQSGQKEDACESASTSEE